MAVMTMTTGLTIPTASISASAKATPTAIVMEAPETAQHKMTSSLVFDNCGQRLSRPAARFTLRVTTRHIKEQTTATAAADGTTQEAEKSWWDKFCVFFGF